jgi:hypothetical protein
VSFFVGCGAIALFLTIGVIVLLFSTLGSRCSLDFGIIEKEQIETCENRRGRDFTAILEAVDVTRDQADQFVELLKLGDKERLNERDQFDYTFSRQADAKSFSYSEEYGTRVYIHVDWSDDGRFRYYSYSE